MEPKKILYISVLSVLPIKVLMKAIKRRINDKSGLIVASESDTLPLIASCSDPLTKITIKKIIKPVKIHKISPIKVFPTICQPEGL